MYHIGARLSEKKRKTYTMQQMFKITMAKFSFSLYIFFHVISWIVNIFECLSSCVVWMVNHTCCHRACRTIVVVWCGVVRYACGFCCSNILTQRRSKWDQNLNMIKVLCFGFGIFKKQSLSSQKSHNNTNKSKQRQTGNCHVLWGKQTFFTHRVWLVWRVIFGL